MKTSFAELLDKFQGVRALVVGDLMLDEYIFGRASRISPEAPVMVVQQKSTARLPGGAANVALNLKALGAQVATLGLIGGDEAGGLLRQAFDDQSLDHSSLVVDSNRPTTRKTRVLADHAHQVLRIDHEDSRPLDSSLEDAILEQAFQQVEQAQVVVLSDYLKGALSEKVAQEIIARARANGIPVIVNPKPQSLPFYRGATLLSLNRKEAQEAAGLWPELGRAETPAIGETLRQKHDLAHLLITLGEEGMIACGDTVYEVGVPKVEVYDTAGAGDTVIATVALGMVARGFSEEVFALAAQTAACVIQHVGVATPSASDLATLRTNK